MEILGHFNFLMMMYSVTVSQLVDDINAREVPWVNFCWVCAAGISESLPHYSLFQVYLVANCRPHLSHF